jgi:hypothetical protein
MNIVIVAKTRMRSGVCIGGLDDESGEMIRLLPAPGSHGWPGTAPLNVGDIWRVGASPVKRTPPHNEDYAVTLEERTGVMNTLRAFITNRHIPWVCGCDDLFDGLIRFTAKGHGFISMRAGVPRNSVGFWVLPAPLRLEKVDGRPYYVLAGSDPPISIKYVGLGQPTALLPEGRLVRLSLARWWTPEHAPHMEPRCYLQLSEWYADEQYELRQGTRSTLMILHAKARKLHADHGDGWVEYDAKDLQAEDWFDDWDRYAEDNPWEYCDDPADNFDTTWGGTFVSGSDDPPGEQIGSDYATDNDDDPG